MFGLNTYALLGGLALVALLSAAGYGLYERGNAAITRAESAETRAAQLTETLQEAEADKARMREDAKRLDAALVEKDKRLAVLINREKALNEQYNALKAKLDEADKACLDRLLPESIASRLRDPSGGIRQDGNPADTPVVPDTVPQVVAP